MTVPIGIDSKALQNSQSVLNLLLADEYVLYTKTLNYHWNVSGVRFHDLHLFFRGQYEELFNLIDDVAERVRTVGGRALGTLHEMQKNSRLQEKPEEVPTDREMVLRLLLDHEKIIESLRTGISSTGSSKDAGTENFLTDILEKHEKMAWMLRSLSEGSSEKRS